MKTPQRRKRNLNGSADVLDAQAAAWLVGAHVETLRRLARRGEVPAYKVGKDWRFNKIALTRWMDTHQARMTPPLVLVVDDEKDIRELVSLFLQKDGYRVTTVESGSRAIEAVQREMPDVVLLDLIMPGMNGVEVLKALHAIKPELPVVIVTGYPDSDMMAEALRYPPVTLLPKPVDNAIVRETVRRLLNGTRRQ